MGIKFAASGIMLTMLAIQFVRNMERRKLKLSCFIRLLDGSSKLRTPFSFGFNNNSSTVLVDTYKYQILKELIAIKNEGLF